VRSRSGLATVLGARVKPEFGPSLPELLESRVLRIPKGLRGAVAVVVIAILIALGFTVAKGGASSINRQVPGMSFSFSYRALKSQTPPAGEYALLQARHGSQLAARLEIAPLRLPAYSGDINGLAPVVMANYIRGLAVRTPGFVLQSEGPTSVNGIAGYNFTYTQAIAGATYFGRVILLTRHASGDRDGLLVSLLAEPVLAGIIGPGRSALAGAIYEPGQGGVGVLFQPAGLLALPLATFRLGS
jgi:hypothetical protein